MTHSLRPTLTHSDSGIVRFNTDADDSALIPAPTPTDSLHGARLRAEDAAMLADVARRDVSRLFLAGHSPDSLRLQSASRRLTIARTMADLARHSFRAEVRRALTHSRGLTHSLTHNQEVN